MSIMLLRDAVNSESNKRSDSLKKSDRIVRRTSGCKCRSQDEGVSAWCRRCRLCVVVLRSPPLRLRACVRVLPHFHSSLVSRRTVEENSRMTKEREKPSVWLLIE